MVTLAVIMTVLNFLVTTMIRNLYRISMTKKVITVIPTACMGKPSNCLLTIAEKPPRKKPFAKAYKGVVNMAQVLLYEVKTLKNNATNKPPAVYQRTFTP